MDYFGIRTIQDQVMKRDGSAPERFQTSGEIATKSARDTVVPLLPTLVLMMLGAGVALTGVFGALAVLIGGLVDDRLKGVGVALGVWLLLAVAYDGIVLMAGVRLADYPLESVDEILAINVKGAFLCLKHVLPGMQARRSGVVVNTASFVGTVVPFPDGALYGASKAAVISLTQSAAVASAEHNVRVFAVCPWITDTPMIDRLTGHQLEAKRQFGAINPSGAIVTPPEVAAVVVRLFSGDEALDNGGAILVDSGGTIQRVRPATACSVPSPTSC